MAPVDRDQQNGRRRARARPVALRTGRATFVRYASFGLVIALGGCSLFADNALSDRPSELAGVGVSSSSSSSSGSASSSSGAGGLAAPCSGCDPASCCDEQCVDLLKSPTSCGACGVSCVSGRTCQNGVCGPLWMLVSSSGQPAPRQQAASVWTSSGMFVWGGRGESSELSDGAIYDPSASAWTPVTNSGAPSARTRAAAVWTGAHVLVWGGGPFQSPDAYSTGGIYDPKLDQWLSMTDAPSGFSRRAPVAVWTGQRMLIWGGTSFGGLSNEGASYDPATDTWAGMSTSGAPEARGEIAAAWSGTELLIFGGRPFGSGASNEGYAYNPATDQWRSFASTGAPEARYDAFAVWMDGELLIYGGRNIMDSPINSAARYNPATDVWTQVSSTGSLSARSAPRGRAGWAVWTGKIALFLGGRDGNGFAIDSATYDPAGDVWAQPFKDWPSGKAHEYGASVWSGSEHFLWSGLDNGLLFTGGESIQP